MTIWFRYRKTAKSDLKYVDIYHFISSYLLLFRSDWEDKHSRLCVSALQPPRRSSKILPCVLNYLKFSGFGNVVNTGHSFVFDVFDIERRVAIIISYITQYLRNRKHVPCFYRVIQTRVEVWENEKCCGNTSRRRVFPQLFRVLPNFHGVHVFYFF